MLDAYSKLIFCSKVAQKGKICSRLLEPRKLLRTPKVAQTLPSTIGRGLQRIQRNRPTPRNKVRARLLANDSARRPATPYPKSRPYSRISGPVFGEKEEVADQLSLWKIPHRSLLPCRGASNFHVLLSQRFHRPHRFQNGEFLRLSSLTNQSAKPKDLKCSFWPYNDV